MNDETLQITATIMVVDDQTSNRLLFEAQLKDEGYGVISADSGETALQLLEQQLPDLVLLDVMMPGLGGQDVAARLKNDERTRNIPIIMLTALDDRDSRLEALSTGAEEFLTKPVDPAELVARIHNLLKQKKSQDELRASRSLLKEQVAERSSQLAEINVQLNEAQERLLQSEKLASIGQLAAGVAHEINNPVGYVGANLGTLKEYLDDLFAILDAYRQLEELVPAEAHERQRLRRLKEEREFDYLLTELPALISESQEGVSRIRKIVQDLKDFARTDKSKEWQRADLHKGLDSTLNVAYNEIKYKADVIKEYGDLPEIECLPSQLNQVFLNLMVNAAHAIGDQQRGKITLRTGHAGNEVWVEVRDTGCGIPPENLKRIFDPFFTTKPLGVGTGLGLSLSYGIVQHHAGRIEVSSQPGQGTAFKVSLPVNQTPKTL
jgi:signal transduction histidine kinase